jgi:hypothetical protein
MSDLLLSWLSQEVGLPVEAVEKVRPRSGLTQLAPGACSTCPSTPTRAPAPLQDFANGYLWGQLFSHFNMQPDFDRFENKRTPDAMVCNYTRLQVSRHSASLLQPTEEQGRRVAPPRAQQRSNDGTLPVRRALD